MIPLLRTLEEAPPPGSGMTCTPHPATCATVCPYTHLMSEAIFIDPVVPGATDFSQWNQEKFGGVSTSSTGPTRVAHTHIRTQRTHTYTHTENTYIQRTYTRTHTQRTDSVPVKDAIVEPEGKDAIVEPAGKDAIVEPEGKDAIVEPAGKDAIVEPGGIFSGLSGLSQIQEFVNLRRDTLKLVAREELCANMTDLLHCQSSASDGLEVNTRVHMHTHVVNGFCAHTYTLHT